MHQSFTRRGLLASAAGAALLPMRVAAAPVSRRPGVHVRIGLNAYSFNKPLSSGAMSLAEMLQFCAEHKVDGLDATGYYFAGYPAVPGDEVIYRFKRDAYLNGITISGTGVRNDFALPDAAARREQIQLVKNWIDVGAKLGAGFIRVFSGKAQPAGYSFDQVLAWMVPAFEECAEYGRNRGVVIGLQHHDDFLKTAAQTVRVVDAVNSEWFSVVLDVGSLRQKDPYEEIEQLLPYACTWQMKENVWYGNKPVPVDLPRVRKIIDKVGFRGFLPVEALAPGDPKTVVAAFLNRVRDALEV